MPMEKRCEDRVRDTPMRAKKKNETWRCLLTEGHDNLEGHQQAHIPIMSGINTETSTIRLEPMALSVCAGALLQTQALRFQLQVWFLSNHGESPCTGSGICSGAEGMKRIRQYKDQSNMCNGVPFSI